MRTPLVTRTSARLGFLAFAWAGPVEGPAPSARPAQISVPADSPRWELEGEAKATDYQGRRCLLLDGGAAALRDLEMRDAVIDVDVATTAIRGFFGIQCRLAD
jgi:hypothetical protein